MSMIKSAPKVKYTNPVWSGYFADPFVLKQADYYYAYGTADQQADGRYFPVLRSKDLVHWEWLAGALMPLNDKDRFVSYWAPEVVEQDGKYYMYYSAGGAQGEHHQIRVAVADRPEGPFADQGRVLLPDEPFSIDAHPFIDPRSGKWYLFFAKDFFDGRAGTGIAMVELSQDLLHVVGPVKTVVRAAYDWQIFARNRSWYGKNWDAWYTCEGPSVVYHDGRYYCLYSAGRWESPNYGVGFASADDLNGPWRDASDAHGPAVLAAVPGSILGPGHNSVTIAPDGETQVIVYHAWDGERKKRLLCLDPLLWNDEGPYCTPSQEERTLYQGSASMQ